MECPTRILDDADVLEIVSLCRCGMSQSEAAQKFNVHETNVNSIMTGRSWSSLTGIKYIVKRPGRKGEKRQKLSDDAVLELRELASAGWTRKALSERSGLHVVTVGMIISGQRRASVKREQLAPCV
jgi:plasmid maintenance system antidote protein VapI